MASWSKETHRQNQPLRLGAKHGWANERIRVQVQGSGIQGWRNRLSQLHRHLGSNIFWIQKVSRLRYSDFRWQSVLIPAEYISKLNRMWARQTEMIKPMNRGRRLPSFHSGLIFRPLPESSSQNICCKQSLSSDVSIDYQFLNILRLMSLSLSKEYEIFNCKIVGKFRIICLEYYAIIIPCLLFFKSLQSRAS